jgi:endonuclease V-like protein UPF0215 family
MTAAHEAVKREAGRVMTVREIVALPRPHEVSVGCLSLLTSVDHDQIPQIIADLRARGEWPEGLRVVGEEQK